MPQDFVIVPDGRTALVVLTLSKATPRGLAMEHAGSILNQWPLDSIETCGYSFGDNFAGFTANGLADINGDDYYPLHQLTKPLYMKSIYQIMALADTKSMVISGAATTLRQQLAIFFPFVKYFCEKYSKPYSMDILSAGFKDMLKFVYDNIPTTRGVNDEEEAR